MKIRGWVTRKKIGLLVFISGIRAGMGFEICDIYWLAKTARNAQSWAGYLAIAGILLTISWSRYDRVVAE